MDISGLVLLASISTLTLLILVLRIIKWKTLIKYHWASDIGFTVVVFFLHQGSMTGVIIAVISGLMFSIILTIGKLFTHHK